jgi:hypothetical protein
VVYWTNKAAMDKKYVLQAFDLKLKGRFDVLLKYYGDQLFAMPALIVVAQIKDELGIEITEQSIYTLKKRLKGVRRPAVTETLDHPLPEPAFHFQQEQAVPAVKSIQTENIIKINE